MTVVWRPDYNGTPGKMTLAQEFTPQSYMYEFPSQYPVWTPADITTALWLDAADASTVTTVSNAVSEWRDKSGNARNATQSTAGNRPTYTSAGQNGFNIVTFQSANTHWLALPNSAAPSGANAVFVACKPNNLTANVNIIGRVYNWGSWYLSSQASGTEGRFSIGRNGIDEANAIVSGLTNNTDKLFSAIYDNVNISLSVNAESPTTTAYTFNPSYNANDAAAIGAFRTSSNVVAGVFNGPMYEIIVLHSVPSTDTRQKLEGYLAHKWGLTANLPSDHPYKLVGPTP